MKIKTFEAPTPAEAMFLARQEMGDDALILHVGPVGHATDAGSRPARFQVTVGMDDAQLSTAQAGPAGHTPGRPTSGRSTSAQSAGRPTGQAATVAQFVPLTATYQLAGQKQVQGRSVGLTAPASRPSALAVTAETVAQPQPLSTSRRLWRRGKQQARLAATEVMADNAAGYPALDDDMFYDTDDVDDDCQASGCQENGVEGQVRADQEPTAAGSGDAQPTVDAHWEVLTATMTEMQQSIRALELAGRQGALTKAFPLIQALDQHLRRQEVAPDLIDELVHVLEERLGRAQFDDPAAIVAAVRAEFLARAHSRVPAIENPPDLDTPAHSMPTIYVVAGLSGSGKSTVLSKLATRLTVGQTGRPRRVGIVSIDHAQVGTTAGLRTLAEILKLPFTMACNPLDLRQAISGWLPSTTGKTVVPARQGVDVILVDTPGYRPEPVRLGEFRTFLQVLPPYSLYLVASATSKYSDVSALAAALVPTEQPADTQSGRSSRKTGPGKVPAHGLIATKLDETTTYGPLLSLACTTGLPVGYLSQGNDVLTGMTPAASHMLVDLVIPPSLSLQPQARADLSVRSTARHPVERPTPPSSIAAPAMTDPVVEIAGEPRSDPLTEVTQPPSPKRLRHHRINDVDTTASA